MIESRRTESIQALRGIAILFVVLFHLRIIEARYGGGEVLFPDLLPHGFGGLDLFIVMSGFTIVTLTRGKFGSPSAALAFLYDRVTRIYPLYWIYSLIALGVYLINPTLVNSAQGNQVDLLTSFLLLPHRLLPLLNVGWFLRHLIYFYLVFTIFLFLLDERRLPLGLLGWAVLVGIGQAIGLMTSLGQDAAFALVTHPLTYEFIAGCMTAKIINAGVPKRGTLLLSAGVAAYVLTVAGMSIVPMTFAEFTWVRAPAFGLPAVLILSGAVNLELERGNFLPRWLTRLGNPSYAIYLSHVPLLTLCGRLWAFVSVPGYVDNLLAVPSIFGAAIVFGVLSYQLVERPLLEKTRAWGKMRLPPPAARAGISE